MPIKKNDTQMNILFVDEVRVLLDKLQIQINKQHTNDDILITLHSLKGITLLFGLDKITKLIFELEKKQIELDKQTQHSQHKQYSQQTKNIGCLFFKLSKMLTKKIKCLNNDISLGQNLKQFNNNLNHMQYANNNCDNKINIHIQTKLKNKLGIKKLSSIYKILFELIKNSHTHAFVNNSNKQQNKKNICIKIFYQNKFLLLSYKDNGVGLISNDSLVDKNKNTKRKPNILNGFGVGMKLLYSQAKTLRAKIKIVKRANNHTSVDANKEYKTGFKIIVYSDKS